MEIRQFMYVSMAAECGSFTKAAEKLFITQPALSSYISKLEEELGVRLFDRSVTPLGLTYAGEKYLAYARDILRQAGKRCGPFLSYGVHGLFCPEPFPGSGYEEDI